MLPLSNRNAYNPSSWHLEADLWSKSFLNYEIRCAPHKPTNLGTNTPSLNHRDLRTRLFMPPWRTGLLYTSHNQLKDQAKMEMQVLAQMLIYWSLTTDACSRFTEPNSIYTTHQSVYVVNLTQQRHHTQSYWWKCDDRLTSEGEHCHLSFSSFSFMCGWLYHSFKLNRHH